MTKFSVLAVAAAAGAMALSAGAASAQPYGANGYYNNGCQADPAGRTALGAIIGGGLGAVLGSQIAASGHRSDGSLVGGIGGAVIGGAIGNRSGCAQQGYAQPRQAPPVAYSGYNGGYARGYGNEMYTGGRGYYGSSYYDDDAYAYGGRGERLRVVERPVSADGCSLAESPIYLPDGRVQKRFVRVCQDSSGRYQVVD